MEEEKPPKAIDVNYQKSLLFREISSDGVVGGPTPSGQVWLAFYTERFPLPRIIRQNIIPADEPGEFRLSDEHGVPVELKSGIIRNVEIGVYLSVEAATQLRDWLSRNIDKISR